LPAGAATGEEDGAAAGCPAGFCSVESSLGRAADCDGVAVGVDGAADWAGAPEAGGLVGSAEDSVGAGEQLATKKGTAKRIAPIAIGFMTCLTGFDLPLGAFIRRQHNACCLGSKRPSAEDLAVIAGGAR
jgi:hypothetical protein